MDLVKVEGSDLFENMNDLELAIKALEQENHIMKVEDGEKVLFLNH